MPNLSALLALLLQTLYALCALGLALYGLHALWLALAILSRRGDNIPPPPLRLDELPHITVQLPIYNERHVVERLLDACAQLDWPRERLQIHVLDDSTDETRALVQRCVHRWRAEGVDIAVIERAERVGYKAGALAHALPHASGDFIALFDADFVPSPNFLREVVPHFLTAGHERVAFVQARWAHLNANCSPLTDSQALAIDGHFAVEQAGRQAVGALFGFNGTAGVWRRACLEDAAVGGWQADTLCEDLDLSYRAQLAGWQPLYLGHVEAPAEVPPQLTAFKRQQARWATGSIQTLRKLGGRVWREEFCMWQTMDRYEDESTEFVVPAKAGIHESAVPAYHPSEKSFGFKLPLLGRKASSSRQSHMDSRLRGNDTRTDLLDRKWLVDQNKLPLWKRLAALAHLGSYLIHPLLLLLLLITPPLVILSAAPAWQLVYLSLLSVGPPLLYAVAQHKLHGSRWWRRFRWLPLLMLLGTGLCWNNALAVARAFGQRDAAFLRTPKFDVTSRITQNRPNNTTRWQRSRYRLPLPPTFWGELVLLAYASAGIVIAVLAGAWWAVPLLALYLGGFGSVVGISLWQAWQARAAALHSRSAGVILAKRRRRLYN